MKKWQNIQLNLYRVDLNVASDLLFELGALSVSILPKNGTEPQYGFDEPNEKIKPSSEKDTISFLLDVDVDPMLILKPLGQQLGLPKTPHGHITLIEDQDWVKHTQDQFPELTVNQHLRIVPPWQKASPFSGKTITIEPGSAFGTGTHPTTHLCLDWISKNITSSQSILDYGCGSGILLIAALAFGAKSGDGVDIDPLALENAKHNCALNNMKPRFYLSDHFPTCTYEVVVANILANPLISLAPLLSNYCSENGTILMTGILEEQGQKVIEAYQPFFDIDIIQQKQEWVLLKGIRF